MNQVIIKKYELKITEKLTYRLHIRRRFSDDSSRPWQQDHATGTAVNHTSRGCDKLD